MSDESDLAEVQRVIRKEVEAMNRELEKASNGEGDDEVRHITAEENTERWNGHWYDGDGDRERVDGRLVQSQITSLDEEPTEEEMASLESDLKKYTTLSDQEAALLVRLHMEPVEICNELDISMSHYESLLHGRLPNKLREARQTVEFLDGEFTVHQYEEPDENRHAHALGACGGPGLYGYDECQNDVETAVKNPEFDHHIELTLNYHDYDEVDRDYVKMRFCSLECLDSYLENDLADYFEDEVRKKRIPRTFVHEESFDDDGTFIGWADGHDEEMPVWKIALQNDEGTMGSSFELAHSSMESAVDRAKELFAGDTKTSKVRTVERID